MSNHHEMLDRVSSEMTTKLVNGLDRAVKAMKMMFDNDIEPQDEHQTIAYLWVKDRISDDEFVRLARLISEEFSHERAS